MSDNDTDTATASISIQVPLDLKEKIEAIAKQEERSIASLVRYYLKQSLPDLEPQTDAQEP